MWSDRRRRTVRLTFRLTIPDFQTYNNGAALNTGSIFYLAVAWRVVRDPRGGCGGGTSAPIAWAAVYGAPGRLQIKPGDQPRGRARGARIGALVKTYAHYR